MALSVPPFTDSKGAQYALYYESACTSECEEYVEKHPEQGVHDVEFLQYGLQLALDRYLDRAVQIVAAANSTLTENGGARDFEALRSAQSLVQDFKPFLMLGEQLRVASENYHSTLEETVSLMQHEKVIGACVLVSLMVLGHMISMKAFNRIDRNIKNSKTLLILLPSEVYLTVPEMRKLLQEEGKA
mmetsp:Transcript_11339/g.28642  ORF Transcript_11339/g.28642 Transcript_11339/m.28642 type:complete len:187 (+) Transcript_11339:3-563(+)